MREVNLFVVRDLDSPGSFLGFNRPQSGSVCLLCRVCCFPLLEPVGVLRWWEK